MSFKQGALIAIAAGGLFAAACKKADDKPTMPSNGVQPEAAKSGEMKAGDQPGMAPAGGDEKTAKVHCMGVNECKGRGGCATASNSCAGQNGCGGQGFVDMAEEECKAKGGTVMAKTMKH
ncbi:MAG TPA: hypothetical protein VNO30_32465 [Kofleriaceae bacterium]|nr:hypothetical protein [Kofleriaceae bacterium]